MVSVPSCCALAISARFRIEKSSSAPRRIWWRSRKSSVISVWAAVVPTDGSAPTKRLPLTYFWRPPWIFAWKVVTGTNAASS